MELSEVLDRLTEILDEAGLKRLAVELDLAYEHVPGDSSRERLAELVDYAARHGRLSDLSDLMVDLEPSVAPLLFGLTGSQEDELAWLDEAAGEDESNRGTAYTRQVKPPEEPAPNPFMPGVAIDAQGMFFGRHNELSALQRRLEEGVHSAVVGNSRLGVSSLLRALCRTLVAQESGYVAAYVNLASDEINSLTTLVQAVWIQWWEQIRPGPVPAVENLKVLTTLIEKVANAGYRLVLLLDEFEHIAWRASLFGPDFFAMLQRLARSGHLLIVTGSHEAPADLMLRADLASNLYRELLRLDLGLLEEDAARALLTEPLSRAPRSAEEKTVATLLALAGPHPFYLQLAGRLLYDTLSQPDYGPANVETRFRVAAEPFWSDLWDSLSPLAQSVLLPGSSPPDIPLGRYTRQLETRGILKPARDGFQLFSEGFANWLTAQQAAHVYGLSREQALSDMTPAASSPGASEYQRPL